MGYCIVSGCSNRSSNKRKNWEQLEKENNHSKFSFHLFPKDPDKCNKWLEALNLKNWYPCKTAAVCSAHFKEEDYEPNLALKRLKKDAIPYLPVNETLKKTGNIVHESSVAQSLKNVEVGTSNEEILISMDEITNSNVQIITLQHASNVVTRSTSSKRIFNSSIPLNVQLQKPYIKELQLLKRKLYDATYEKKTKKEVYRLRITLKELKKKHDLIPMNNFDFLQLLSDCIKELIKCELRKHKCLPVYLKIN